jgi:hypothetical protein
MDECYSTSQAWGNMEISISISAVLNLELDLGLVSEPGSYYCRAERSSHMLLLSLAQYKIGHEILSSPSELK